MGFRIEGLGFQPLGSGLGLGGSHTVDTKSLA